MHKTYAALKGIFFNTELTFFGMEQENSDIIFSRNCSYFIFDQGDAKQDYNDHGNGEWDIDSGNGYGHGSFYGNHGGNGFIDSLDFFLDD